MKCYSCWICNASADTREHTIKQSDIRRLFGHGPYDKGNRLARTDEARNKKIIQSEDSVHIKYQRSLCKYCNSTRSQPWDQAYDKFMDFIQVHGQRVKQTRKINLCDIMTGHGRQLAITLYSYFVKAFGCQLVEHGRRPPLDLSEYLLGRRSNTGLVLTFAIYSSFPTQLPAPIVQIHDLEGDVEVETGKPLNYTWAVSVEWLTIIYWYRKQPSPALGCPWDGTSDQIEMGRYNDIQNSQ